MKKLEKIVSIGGIADMKAYGENAENEEQEAREQAALRSHIAAKVKEGQDAQPTKARKKAIKETLQLEDEDEAEDLLALRKKAQEIRGTSY